MSCRRVMFDLALFAGAAALVLGALVVLLVRVGGAS